MKVRAPSRSHRRKVILFLAANPRGTERVTLAEECAELQRELKMSTNRARFVFESRWAVTVDEMMRHLTELTPDVVHFSGHGEPAGLLLQDERGEPQLVSEHALALMLEAASPATRLLVLNACYTGVSCEELRAQVDCVVGMAGEIEDIAARAYSMRFYGALANGRSVGNAHQHGIAALAAKGMPDAVLPRCLPRDGVSANELFLGCPSARS